jgi:hypothetical protein
MVELPKTWALEFIRQQLDQTTNVHSNDSNHATNISVVACATTTAAPPQMIIPKEPIDLWTVVITPPIVHTPVTLPAVTGTNPTTTTTTTIATTSTETCTETSNAFLIDDETIKRRRRSSLLRRSVSSGDVFVDHKKRMATYTRDSIVLSQQLHQNPLGDDDDEDLRSDDDDDDREHSFSNESLKSANEVKTKSKQESNTSNSQWDDGADWLPSLSRFTSTQSFLSQSSLLSWNRTSKKVLSPFGLQRPILERTPSWSEGITDIQTNHDRNIIIHTANALDVIFMKKVNVPHQSSVTDGETYQLIPTQHTGNSRIAVMVQLDMPKYLEYLTLEDVQNDTSGPNEGTGSSVATSNSKIRQLCRDLVNALQTNYDGRFLMEQNDAIEATLGDDNNIDYYVLSKKRIWTK